LSQYIGGGPVILTPISSSNQRIEVTLAGAYALSHNIAPSNYTQVLTSRKAHLGSFNNLQGLEKKSPPNLLHTPKKNNP